MKWVMKEIGYGYMSFLASLIDCDHSKKCNRLRSPNVYCLFPS